MLQNVIVTLSYFPVSPAALKKELEATRSKFNVTSEKFLEKSRQYQKLQVHVQTLLYMSVVCIVH